MRQRPSKQIVPQPARQLARRPVSRTPTAFLKQPVAELPGGVPIGYKAFLSDVKARIRTAQIKASLSANREMIQLYWGIGRDIVLKQESQGWGAKVIDRLAADLQREFPGLTGFSRGNIYRMRAFYLAYGPSRQFVAQPARQLTGATAAPTVKPSNQPIVAQPARQLDTDAAPEPIVSLPWFHNVVLIEHLKEPTSRLWYAQQTIANGWSRSVLEHWIDSDLYGRQGKSINNFKATLPAPQSDLAQQLIKDPFKFDFLTLAADAAERELEQGLLAHIRKFLLELGSGFAFVGQQVRVEVDGQEFSIDLLFYHLRLRCYVVVDLKVEEFKPEFAGKMNFYLSTVDDQMRHADDKPSIGLILCKTRKKTIAEYALRDLAKPVGVARYVTKLVESLPKQLAGSLPSIEQIEAELATETANPTTSKPANSRHAPRRRKR
jgi:predicted nuclease of restriction endonuclease-like (RecB) superfamily